MYLHYITFLNLAIALVICFRYFFNALKLSQVILASPTIMINSPILFVHWIYTTKRHLQPLVLQTFSLLLYVLLSEERTTAEALSIHCKVVSHSWQSRRTCAPVLIISQPSTSVSSTMLLFLLISLQLMPAGQRSQKVRLLPLITLCASARIKSCSFHPPVFHILNCGAVCAFSLICFVCSRQLCCFCLSTVATGEWRGNKQTCARCLWCINKRLRGWECWRLGGGGSIPISILLHSAMQMRLWVSVALSCFLKWVELESDWRRRVRWILSS